MTIEKWYIKNLTTNELSIGDLPKVPSLQPNVLVDLLQYYEKEYIENSPYLKTALARGLAKIYKKRNNETNIITSLDSLEQVEQDELTASENRIFWDDLRVPVTSTQATGVAQPVFARYKNNGLAPIGQAAYLQDNEYGTIPYDASLDLPSDYAISFWVYPITGGGFGSLSRIMLERDGHFIVRTSGDSGQLYWSIDGIGTLSSNSGALSLDTWNHVVANLVFNSSTSNWEPSLYINNTVVSSSITTSSPNNSDNTIYVGERPNTGRWLGGYMDELAFFSAALTPSEISTLYANGAGQALEGTEDDLAALYHFDNDTTDSSSNSNTMTFTNGTYVTGHVGGDGSIGVFTYFFQAGISQELFFSAQIPHGYKQGTNLRPHVHWIPRDSGSGTVKWGFEYIITKIHGTYGLTSTLTGETEVVNQQDQHLITSFGEIDGTNLTSLSSMLVGRIFRERDDTYSGDVGLLEFDIHYQFDAPGSVQPFSKT